MPPNTLTNGNPRVHFDAHAEIQVQSRSRDLQRASNVTLREGVEEVVGGNRVFHDAQIGGTLCEMLALSASVLGPNLLAVDALHRQTLFPSQIPVPRHARCTISYLVFVFGTELDKGSMDIIQGRSGKVRIARL